jgi:hypothetical protein
MAKLSRDEQFYVGQGKIHIDTAADHKAESERVGTDTPIGKLHSMIAAFHNASAKHLAAMLDSMGKAAGDELMPTNVRAVIPPRNTTVAPEIFTKIYGGSSDDNETAGSANVFAVPRSGQPPINAPTVPLGMEKFVATDDESTPY